jgi:hypothetical protein
MSLEQSKEPMKREMQDWRRELETLRDEIRLQIHLGGAELKERWTTLEPRMEEAEQYVKQISQEGSDALRDLVRHFRDLRKNLAEISEQRRLRRH